MLSGNECKTKRQQKFGKTTTITTTKIRMTLKIDLYKK